MMKLTASRSVRFRCVMERKTHITAFSRLSTLYHKPTETLLDKMKTTGEATVLQTSMNNLSGFGIAILGHLTLICMKFDIGVCVAIAH